MVNSDAEQSVMMAIALGIAKGMNFLHTLEPPASLIQLSSKHVMVSNKSLFLKVKKLISYLIQRLTMT
jgi:hypothetical protein